LDFLIIGVSCAARSSLQPALAPLEAFEVLVLIARIAEIEFLDILVVTQFAGGAIEPDLGYSR
jgi:hypothetical protein